MDKPPPVELQHGILDASAEYDALKSDEPVDGFAGVPAGEQLVVNVANDALNDGLCG